MISVLTFRWAELVVFVLLYFPCRQRGLIVFGDKKRRIQTLEQQLSAGEQQYNAALASIGELRVLLDRVGGGDLVKMQEVAAQLRCDQVELQAALERQKLEFAQQAASAEENLRALERDAREVGNAIDDRRSICIFRMLS